MKTLSYLLAFLICGPICQAFEQAQKDAEIRKMLETVGYPERFKEEQPKFLAYIKKERPQASESDMKVLARHLAEKDFAGSLVPVVGAYLTEEDVEAVNSFGSQGPGKKEVQFMLDLEVEIESGRESVDHIPNRRDSFYLTLSPEERATIVAFRNSVSGKRYWDCFSQIQAQYMPVFVQMSSKALEEAHEELSSKQKG